MSNIYEHQLHRQSANHVALSPVNFVERCAEVFGDQPAVVHGSRRYSWAQTRDRAARLAAALRALGVGRGSTVSEMLPKTPEMMEAHYAVPALSAVLNTLNTRLDASLPGAAVTAAELVAHSMGLLAGYKFPREIRFEEIPKTSTGKIQKFQLRERAKSSSAID